MDEKGDNDRRRPDEEAREGRRLDEWQRKNACAAMQWRMPNQMPSPGAKIRLPTVTSAAAAATMASRRKKAGRFRRLRWASASETPTSARNVHATACEKSRIGGENGSIGETSWIVGEVPAEVVERHADQRDAAGAVDRVDAAAGLRRPVGRRRPGAHNAASNSAPSRTRSPSNSTGPVIST